MGLGRINTNPDILVVSQPTTNTYTVFDWLDVSRYNSVMFYVSYAMGAAETANYLEIKIEFSPTKVLAYQEPEQFIDSNVDAITPLTHQFLAVSAAGVFDRFTFGIDSMPGHKFMRISVREVGVAANQGTVAVEAAYGWNT